MSIPVTIITGFLGSGKTTLLNQLIQHPRMEKVAVLVNEFGEIGLDHLLVETVSEDIVLLQSGCICCQVKDDLAATLIALLDRRRSGAVEAFERVLIETTGVADPVPVVQVLMADPQLSGHFHPAGVLTLVDAVLGQAQLEQHRESVRQVALADRLLLTKTDLPQAVSHASLRAQLRQLNATAPLVEVVSGHIHPDALFTRAGPDSTGAKRIQRWLHGAADTGGKQSPAAASASAHTAAIDSVSITLDQPIDWNSFSEWLDSLIFARANHLLRIKGILDIRGETRPVVIQGVQHIFYPPYRLAQWPGAERRSQLVFITWQFEAAAIAASLRAFLDGTSALHTATGTPGTAAHAQ